jgi:hypothetical protein
VSRSTRGCTWRCQIVAYQLLADQPPEIWQSAAAGRAGLHRHNIMHMIVRVISDDPDSALGESREFDPDDHARRLSDLPDHWPLPQTPEPSLGFVKSCGSSSRQANGGP